jgi:hypothetical protein
MAVTLASLSIEVATTPIEAAAMGDFASDFNLRGRGPTGGLHWSLAN